MHEGANAGQHETAHKNTYNQGNLWRGCLNPLKRPLYTDSNRHNLWIINYNASHGVAVVHIYLYVCVCYYCYVHFEANLLVSNTNIATHPKHLAQTTYYVV
jgi:hypothetical protein